MIDYKENVKAPNSLNKRLHTLREKNRKLIVELEKKEKQSDQTGPTMEALSRKASKKYVLNRNELFEAEDDTDSAPNGFRVVKIPLNKLVPLTIERYR